MAEKQDDMKQNRKTQRSAAANHPASRKKKKPSAVKKIVIITLSAVLVLGGAGALIINHYFNKVPKIDLSTETTLSPEEFWALIGSNDETEESVPDSGESGIAEETPNTSEPDNIETDPEPESGTEETESLNRFDPDETDVRVIQETTKANTPTTKWVAPTVATRATTKAASVPNNYGTWKKASSLNDESLINILLIGVDATNSSGRARTDTIMLLSVNPGKNKASLISFMRDMYVPIHDGYGSSRINHAYEAGGVSFLTQCLQNNFGLHIDGTVKIDFSGFAKAVDILGGVDISLTENEVKMMKSRYIDYSGRGLNPSMIHTGSCHLDGNAALTYCRIRNLDNDYNRTARQRKMMTLLFNKVKHSGAGTLQNLANTVLGYCQTTMSNGTMASYLSQILPKASSLSLSSYRLPVAGSYRDIVISKMQVLQCDQQKNITALKSYLPW